MNKIFLMLDGEKVTLIHNMPFDPINGLQKSEAELVKTGALVDSVPEPESVKGKHAIPMYNKSTGFYYAYEDIELTDSEMKIKAQENQIIAIENALAELTYGGIL